MRTGTPLFSVIIPTYNRLHFLGRALESVWRQNEVDFEVIVVDDGSTDGTQEWLAKQDGNMRVLTQRNCGPGAARNLAANQARGEYLAFLDSDDLWFPWSLGCYREVIHEEKGPAFIAGNPLRFCTEDDCTNARPVPLSTQRFCDYIASGDVWRWWGVSSFVIEKAAFDRSGGFSSSNVNGEDADLALKLGVSAGFVQVTSPYTFGYREHSDNVASDLSKCLGGAWLQISSERTGLYPGGPLRAKDRRRILTRHIRPVTLWCLHQGLRGEAWALYRATFGWHLCLGRWKFMAGFPALAVWPVLRKLGARLLTQASS